MINFFTKREHMYTIRNELGPDSISVSELSQAAFKLNSLFGDPYKLIPMALPFAVLEVSVLPQEEDK